MPHERAPFFYNVTSGESQVSQLTNLKYISFYFFRLIQKLEDRMDGAKVECIPGQTSANDGADQPVMYLDRHNIECTHPYTLAQFTLKRVEHNKFYYAYRCCKFVL